MVTVSSTPVDSGGSGGGGGQGGTSSGDDSQLSHNQKLEVEECGRSFAKRKLKENGWDVEEMPQKHPGFDLKATRDGNELRVEVKAHRGLSPSAELTARERSEYLACKKLGAVTWQLWNVENVAANAQDAHLTCYDDIPEDAFRARQFSVDLRQCKPLEELP